MILQSAINKCRKNKNIVNVVIAIIRNGDSIFIQKRTSNDFLGGFWEFPGGKVEKNESLRSALKREVMEETGIKIKKICKFISIEHSYDDFTVHLHCFLAQCCNGKKYLLNKKESKWVKKRDLKSYNFPPASLKLIKALQDD